MKCDKIRELLPEYLGENLPEETAAQIDTHVQKCQSCKQEMEQLGNIWHLFGNLPEEEPQPALRNRFYTMLETYKHGLQHSTLRKPWSRQLSDLMARVWPRRPVVQFALSLCFLLIGLLLGNNINLQLFGTNEVLELRSEVKEMRQMMTLSLLRQTSSSERIRGVSLSTHVEQPTESLMNALINTLDSDPSINVRLAAVEALFLFRDLPGVRTSLVESLAKQKSPMVQISLIDLMVSIREKKALDALRQLINNEKVDSSVKERAQWGIEQII